MSLQRTPEWDADRRGKCTASRLPDVLAKLKSGGWGASRANYAAQLIAERLSGQSMNGYVSAAMQHGIDTEPEGRLAYQYFMGHAVEECGFINHPSIAMAGASPDGLIGRFGLLEIKCPQPATHQDYLTKGRIDPAYHAQMRFQLACTGREWVDWVSYCPAMPEQPMITLPTGAQTNCRLITGRYTATLDEIIALENEVRQFLTEVDAGVRAVQGMWGKDWVAPQ